MTYGPSGRAASCVIGKTMDAIDVEQVVAKAVLLLDQTNIRNKPISRRNGS
jgi:hypothetical protein